MPSPSSAQTHTARQLVRSCYTAVGQSPSGPGQGVHPQDDAGNSAVWLQCSACASAGGENIETLMPQHSILYSRRFCMGNVFSNFVDRLQFAKIFPTNICISQVTQFAVNGSTNVYHCNCQQSGKEGNRQRYRASCAGKCSRVCANVLACELGDVAAGEN